MNATLKYLVNNPVLGEKISRGLLLFERYSRHDRHIKHKTFKGGDLVLFYDSKFVKFPGKFCMHWLGPYQVKHVTNGGVVQLTKLNGEIFPTLVNGSKMKLYRDSPPCYLA
jgi:signal peptidase I